MSAPWPSRGPVAPERNTDENETEKSNQYPSRSERIIGEPLGSPLMAARVTTLAIGGSLWLARMTSAPARAWEQVGDEHQDLSHLHRRAGRPHGEDRAIATDLGGAHHAAEPGEQQQRAGQQLLLEPGPLLLPAARVCLAIELPVGLQEGHGRSEERRVGKECRSRWWP